MKFQKTIAATLSAAMLLSVSSFAATPSDFSDFPADWSTDALTHAVENGLLNGSDGKINAKGTLTRAQMAAIVNRAFGAEKAADLTRFVDMLQSAWYYNDMGKAVQMGTFVGSGDKLNPEAPITREQAFAVLARAFALPDGNASSLSKFSDSASVSSWAVGSAAALVEAGYVNGSDGKLNPKGYMTRAEFAQMMDNLVKAYVTTAETVTQVPAGNVIVRAGGATLKNITVDGDLVIADGATSVTLDGVTVKGNIILRGGANGVTITGSTSANGVTVENPNGTTVVSGDGSKLGTVHVKTDLTVNGTLSNASVDEKATLTVNQGGKVGSVTVNAPGSQVKGSGTVNTVQANASNTTVTTPNTKVTAGTGTSNVKAGDKTVEPGKTETVGTTNNSGGSSSGGGSSSSSYQYVLMNIPYAEFYKAEINNDNSVDAVSSATTTKSVKFAGSYYEQSESGVQIKGVKFPVRVKKSDLSSISLTDLTESSDYYYTTESSTPAVYKELTIENGNKTFSEVKGTSSDMTADVSLSTDTPWGDYLVEITQNGEAVDFGTVYGIVVKTGDGTSYGLRHLENIWLKNYEFAWSVGLKTSEPHGNQLNGTHYASMMGKTISEIEVITNTGIKTIKTETYVPKKFANTLSVANALTTAKATTLTADNFPSDYEKKYTVTNAAGEEQTGFEVKDGQLTWGDNQAIGAYTLTVSDANSGYASYSTSFELQTNELPAQAGNQAIVKTNNATDAEFTAFLTTIKSVQIGENTYVPSGRGAVKIINADGTINENAKANGEALFADGKTRTLVISATGYSQTLSVEYTPTYTYAYAAVPYNEYWKNEGVYLNGSDWTASSDVADRTTTNKDGSVTEEHDKGAFDAVSRATTNHGLHRGSFQQDVVIHTAEKDYHPVYWTDGNNFVDQDGNTYDKTTIGITSYNITGIKYVPVKVATADFAAFCTAYTVTKNGEMLAGGYSEQNLTSYSDLVAAVDADTNGLKEVTKIGDSFTFGARKTGNGSGIKGQSLKTADEAITAAAKDYSGNFGEMLRVDLNNNYGDLGSHMQTVVWKYYGNGDTVLATYGTKFAADDWMHKSMGIQLGLTDSLRFQLPADTDGTGKWTITVYALGYSDTTYEVNVTADNLPKAVEPMTTEQKTQLENLRDQAKTLLGAAKDPNNLTVAESTLKSHYDEIVALLANEDATKTAADELIQEVPGYITAVENERAAQPTTKTANGEATVSTFNYTAKVTVTYDPSTGKITEVTDNNTTPAADGYSPTFWNNAKALFAKLVGKTKDEVSSVDAISGATLSSNAIKQAVLNALAD